MVLGSIQQVNVPDKCMTYITLFCSGLWILSAFCGISVFHGYYPHFVGIICILWMYPHFVDIICIGHIMSNIVCNVIHVLHTYTPTGGQKLCASSR